MFVVAADFDTPPFNLPSLDTVVNTFPDFVEEQEASELSKVFGNLFYDAFIAGLALLPADWVQTVTPNGYDINDLVVSGSDIYKSLAADNVALVSDAAKWEIQPVNRWLKLKIGAAYSYQNYPYKWVGMKDLVKPMIYSLWIRTQQKRFTGTGAVVDSNENSENVSAGDFIVDGWNTYCRVAQGWTRGGWGAMSVKDCLYGYLYVNASTFNDLVSGTAYSDFLGYLLREFCPPHRQNVFDL